MEQIKKFLRSRGFTLALLACLVAAAAAGVWAVRTVRDELKKSYDDLTTPQEEPAPEPQLTLDPQEDDVWQQPVTDAAESSANVPKPASSASSSGAQSGSGLVHEPSALQGESVNKLARVCTKNPILRYLVLPFVSAFMLGNPMALSMGKFMPEFYKPAYYASATYHCHTNNGIFPHINASELFVWLGIANGISTLKLDTTPLAVRYLLVGLVANFISGWVTEFTTRYVEKQQGVKLSRTLKISEN